MLALNLTKNILNHKCILLFFLSLKLKKIALIFPLVSLSPQNVNLALTLHIQTWQARMLIRKKIAVE